MRYYDKNGNAAANSIGSTTFFTAGLSLKDAAGNAIDRFNDLRVIFDSYRKRFWVTAYAYFSGSANVPMAKRRYLIPLAVSKTENPLDGWIYYYTDGAAQQGQAGSKVWQEGDAPDYPIMGVDKLAVTVTHAVNHQGGGGYWRVLVFQADALAGGQWQGGWQYWDLKNPDGSDRHHHAGRTTRHSHRRTRVLAGPTELGLGGRLGDYPPVRQPAEARIGRREHSEQVQRPGQRPAAGLDQVDQVHEPLEQRDEGGLPKRVPAHGHQRRARLGQHRQGADIDSLHSAARFQVAGRTEPTASGGVDRVFGGGNPNEKVEGLKHYGWAAVEANKNGDAIIGYARTGEQV